MKGRYNMYLFYIYIQNGVSPDIECDTIYAKVLGDYTKVAEYVNFLNQTSDYDYYYFMRESAYLDTDSVIIVEKNII